MQKEIENKIEKELEWEKYFENEKARIYIAFHFDDKWQDWYNKIERELSVNFDTEDLSKTNFLHITIISPFWIDKNNLFIVKNTIGEINKNFTEVEFNINGISNFDDKKTIFLDTKLSEQSISSFVRLYKIIKIFNESDNLEFSTENFDRIDNLHASLVRNIKLKDFDNLFQYLNKLDFLEKEYIFDNIVIYIKNLETRHYDILS